MRRNRLFSKTLVRPAALAALIVALGFLGQPRTTVFPNSAVASAAPSPQAQPAAADVFTTSGVADSVDRLAWLAGCWEGTLSNGASYEEVWLGPRGGTLIGMARMVRDGQTSSFDFMRVVDDEGTLVFIAQPSGQEVTRFRATEVTSEGATFENPDHDFPQKVLYRLTPPDGLVARIEGERNGEFRGIDFSMSRGACAQ